MPLALLLACAAPGADTSATPDPADSAGADPDTAVSDTGPDTAGDPVDTAAAFCEDAPTLAWANFGEGFMRENCQGCHASTTPDRHGAPDNVAFDTAAACWDLATDILRAATGDDPSMPPQGGVAADDRTRLEWWLRCGTPGA